MADPEQLRILKEGGVDAWNEWWRRVLDARVDLIEASPLASLLGSAYPRADLSEANLSGANLSGANLIEASLIEASLIKADLTGATLIEANLSGATLIGANLSKANLSKAHLTGTNLIEANLIEAGLIWTDLIGSDLSGATLVNAHLTGANLAGANLTGANLTGAKLSGATLSKANLTGAKLSGANLTEANLSEANLSGADLTGSRIFGVSAWRLKLSERTQQQNLVITPYGESEITVDNIEVAQFIDLLLHNEKIRDAIDTIGKKGVLLLGRFTEGRIAILKRLRDELRKRNFLPLVFNFDKPETKNFTETIRLLAGLAHFVIADVTNPKSAPLELQATVPEIMVPFRPIIEEGQEPFAMLRDLWVEHRDWVFEPLYYSSLDALVGALDEKIIRPAKVRFAELLARKAEEMKGEHV